MHFVTCHPAILAEKTVIVADLHIGIEREMRARGIKVPSQTAAMLARLEEIVKVTEAEQLVVVGDVKHKVPGSSFQEEREIPEFFEKLQQKCETAVVAGNHDGGLREMLPSGTRLYPSTGHGFGDCFVTHGHAWPGKGFHDYPYLVAGHTHPIFEFSDKLGYKFREQVWLRAAMDKAKLEKKYGRLESVPELVVMPAFNPLAGGFRVNAGLKSAGEEYIGPPAKCAKMAKAKVYMMDGIYLGELAGLGRKGISLPLPSGKRGKY